MTKEEHKKQKENLFNHYVDNKDWNKIHTIINNSSYSEKIQQKAKKILEDEGKL